MGKCWSTLSGQTSRQDYRVIIMSQWLVPSNFVQVEQTLYAYIVWVNVNVCQACKWSGVALRQRQLGTDLSGWVWGNWQRQQAEMERDRLSTISPGESSELPQATVLICMHGFVSNSCRKGNEPIFAWSSPGLYAGRKINRRSSRYDDNNVIGTMMKLFNTGIMDQDSGVSYGAETCCPQNSGFISCKRERERERERERDRDIEGERERKRGKEKEKGRERGRERVRLCQGGEV